MNKPTEKEVLVSADAMALAAKIWKEIEVTLTNSIAAFWQTARSTLEWDQRKERHRRSYYRMMKNRTGRP